MGNSKRAWDSGEDRRREQSAPALGAAKEPMNRKDYEKALRELQVDLCALQEWVKHKGLRVVVVFEDGIFLVKFWLEVSDEEQKRRFEAHIKDPLRQWKLSPMDLASRSKWFEYSRARDIMFKATDRDFAPWTIVPSDDKRRARLNCIRHLLKVIPHEDAPRVEVKLPRRSMKGAYDDVASLKGLRFVEDSE